MTICAVMPSNKSVIFSKRLPMEILIWRKREIKYLCKTMINLIVLEDQKRCSIVVFTVKEEMDRQPRRKMREDSKEVVCTKRKLLRKMSHIISKKLQKNQRNHRWAQSLFSKSKVELSMWWTPCFKLFFCTGKKKLRAMNKLKEQGPYLFLGSLTRINHLLSIVRRYIWKFNFVVNYLAEQENIKQAESAHLLSFMK